MGWLFSLSPSSEWSWQSPGTDTAVGMVDTGTDMALDTVMDTVDTARGLLLLMLSLDMHMLDTDMDMAISDTDMEAMDIILDMARGLLRLPLDIMDTTDTMAMDMDMDTMVRKERYQTGIPLC